MDIRKRKVERSRFTNFINKWGVNKLYSSCCICGWQECKIDLCHIIPHKNGGDYSINNIVPLCPNHHRVLDRNLLRVHEMNKITEFVFKIHEIFIPHLRVNGSTEDKIIEISSWNGLKNRVEK